jgi:hypothetical protein
LAGLLPVIYAGDLRLEKHGEIGEYSSILTNVSTTRTTRTTTTKKNVDPRCIARSDNAGKRTTTTILN